MIDDSCGSSFMYQESKAMPILQNMWSEAFAAGVASVLVNSRTVKFRRMAELQVELFNNPDNKESTLNEYLALHKELFPYKH